MFGTNLPHGSVVATSFDRPPRTSPRSRGVHRGLVASSAPGRYAGATSRRITVFFSPLGRSKTKPACSYIPRVPL